MADTVKVIENIDRLFSEIEVNGETYKSDKAIVNTSPVIHQEDLPPATDTVEERQATEKENLNTEPVIVTKTIEAVDEMFSEIEVNGETFTSDKPIKDTSPVIHQEERITAEETLTEEKEIVSKPPLTAYGESVNAVELNGTIHNIEDEQAQITAQQVQTNLIQEKLDRQTSDYALQQLINTESQNRISGDSTLQGYIDTLQSSINELQGKLDAIKALVPLQASEDNQLADKDFVNSSIATNTSNFIGTFNTLEELEQQTATNNDYAFWKTTDSDGNVLFKRYKYVSDDSTWQFEYDLNNSSFTAEQWATINSGLTQASIPTKVSQLTNDSNYASVNQALMKSGGTMTGGIDTRTNSYFMSDGYGINMHNSDIVGANRLVFGDYAEGCDEGITFTRTNGNYDTMALCNGHARIYKNHKKSDTGTTSGVQQYNLLDTQYVDHKSYCTASVVSGGVTTATASIQGAVRFGNFLSLSIAVNPTAQIAGGQTVLVRITDSQATLPSTAHFGVAGGASFYGQLVFTYQFNTDNAGLLKIRPQSNWPAGYNTSMIVNIPLLSYSA